VYQQRKMLHRAKARGEALSQVLHTQHHHWRYGSVFVTPLNNRRAKMRHQDAPAS
jgi:hypothetical protein